MSGASTEQTSSSQNPNKSARIGSHIFDLHFFWFALNASTILFTFLGLFLSFFTNFAFTFLWLAMASNIGSYVIVLYKQYGIPRSDYKQYFLSLSQDESLIYVLISFYFLLSLNPLPILYMLNLCIYASFHVISFVKRQPVLPPAYHERILPLLLQWEHKHDQVLTQCCMTEMFNMLSMFQQRSWTGAVIWYFFLKSRYNSSARMRREFDRLSLMLQQFRVQLTEWWHRRFAR